MACIVELGRTQERGSPPETEDSLFDPAGASLLGVLSPKEYWKLLTEVAKKDLADIFGGALQQQGQTCTVAVGTGVASLGCLVPSLRPAIAIDSYDRVRARLIVGQFSMNLPVNDLRFYNEDNRTPRTRVVNDVARRIKKGVGVVLSLGLTRPWQKPGDSLPRHWLQLNNIHLEDDPVWQVS
jgi:hypothetical protein